ncbi:MAG: hypothetical protein E4H01_08445 [Lysobacterales bacterium]|nr:MAG: hypothetical protein E4H01_08445 [Xanthomonadales bacterium]
MSAPSLYWTTICWVCLASAGSYAYFPIEAAPPPILRVANSEPTAPVERLRKIPKDAEKGIMLPPQGRQVRINDNLMVLAPGATIRDLNNRMVSPNTLRSPNTVRYTLDMYGQVRRIWISPTGDPGRQPTLPPTLRD